VTAPEGFVRVWLPDSGWETVSEREGLDRRCRWGAGFHRRACGKPSVAKLRRSNGWWHYCADHLYGRRLSEDGLQVESLVAVPEAEVTR
jgi:hypothetical protein